MKKLNKAIRKGRVNQQARNWIRRKLTRMGLRVKDWSSRFRVYQGPPNGFWKE